MKSFFQPLLHWIEQYDPRLSCGIAVGIFVLLVLLWWIVRRRRPSAEEQERRRRTRLTENGRITDGHLLDVRSLDGEESLSLTPEVLMYSYRLSGVTYNCAQDVSTLSERVRGYQLDQPLQVRYDPRNPGDSIVVAEGWTGLWRA